MILNVSGRTDVVAFYSEWFWNRYQEGFLDVRNPFYAKMISRIYFKDVDLILFCTKNPKPILKYLPKIEIPILFHVTLTPYKKDIEPNVPPKGKVIECIKKVSSIVGIENIYVRYDPVFINDKYTVEYHQQAFHHMCSLLDGYVRHIIISFLDDYKNVRNNKDMLKNRELQKEDYEKIGVSFSESAKKYHMTVQTCFEEVNLVEYGFIKQDCISHELAWRMTGKIFPKWKARKGNKCECVEMVDVGDYNSCKHFCKYCYANYDEKKVEEKFQNHNPNSTLLIGELDSSDKIKVRK